jgi:hypothetical protein
METPEKKPAMSKGFIITLIAVAIL